MERKSVKTILFCLINDSLKYTTNTTSTNTREKGRPICHAIFLLHTPNMITKSLNESFIVHYVMVYFALKLNQLLWQPIKYSSGMRSSNCSE